MKVLIIDNYDSFTYNLYQYIGEILSSEKSRGRLDDFRIVVKRNDELSLDEIRQLKEAPHVWSVHKVLYYLHAWCNPCIFDAAFLDLPRVGALLVRRLRGATSLPEAMASGLRSVIAGFS